MTPQAALASTRLDFQQFWSEAQANFLAEQIRLDAEWAILVDTLNVQLREQSTTH